MLVLALGLGKCVRDHALVVTVVAWVRVNDSVRV